MSTLEPKEAVPAIDHNEMPRRAWPCPTPEMLEDPAFNAIWNEVKHWDIQVDGVYNGYTHGEGNHVRAILDVLTDAGLKIVPVEG